MANILIVEDDPALLRAMHDLLFLDGHAVQTAESGEEALTLFDGLVPDLILADVLMGGMSGITLAKNVRANPDWVAVPIMFVSASSTPDDEKIIKTIERSYFLRKPFDAQQLQDAVADALGVQ